MAIETINPNRLKNLANRFSITIALFIIFCVTSIVYVGSFKGAFIFDDIESILGNESIRHFTSAFFPPHQQGITVEGRPVLNLSFALNFAISGTHIWSYHLINLLIHLGCSFFVFGIIRRTLLILSYTHELTIAVCTTLLWSIHPLTTESVTYIVQRAESLMGLFFLSTLYYFIRYRTSPKEEGNHFAFISLVSCFLGSGTKEVMATAPLVILSFDYFFLSKDILRSINNYWKLYSALFASWIIVLFLIISDKGRSGTVDFNSYKSSYHYLLTQFYAITHYIKLIFIPNNLIFYYGRDILSNFDQVAYYALFICSSALLTLWALVKRSPFGFLGITFFLILAPSSSFFPVNTETIAEHRMYLSLIPCLLGCVIIVYHFLGLRFLIITVSIACVALSNITIDRNRVYESALSIWSDTEKKLPLNPWAHFYRGWLLEHSGRSNEAYSEYLKTIELKPDFADAHNGLGKLLAEKGNYSEALNYFKTAIRLKPNYAEAHTNLASLYATSGNQDIEAINEFNIALKIDPHFPEANNGYALIIQKMQGREEEALAHFNDALLYRPNYASAHNNLANLLSRFTNQQEKAKHHYEEAIRLSPNDSSFHINFANLLANLKEQQARAIFEYKKGLALNPNSSEAHSNLGLLLSNIAGNEEEAISHYRLAVNLRPNSAALHNNLANVLAVIPQYKDEAIKEYEIALHLFPDYAEAHNNFAQLLATLEGKESQTTYEFQEALKLLPNSVVVHLNFARFLESHSGNDTQAVFHYKAALRLDPNCTPALAGLQRLGAY